jgi:hypothetical protein
MAREFFLLLFLFGESTVGAFIAWMARLIIGGYVRYAIGTPDCISHLAEEIPRPASNLPKAIAAQMAVGFVTFVNPFCVLCMMVSLITPYDLVASSI